MARAKIAEAYVQGVITFDGVQQQIQQQVGGGITNATPAVQQAGTQLGSNAGSAAVAGFDRAAVGIGAAAVAGIGIAAGKALYEIGADFDDMFDGIRIGTGATGAVLEGLEASAKNVFTSVPVTAEEAGAAIADLNTRLGLTGTELETMAQQFLLAEAALGESLDVGAQTAALKAFGVENSELSNSLDGLFQVSQATGVGMDELAVGIQTSAAAAKSLGLDYKDTASVFGILDKAGLDSTRTFAQMSKGIVNLAKDGETGMDAFTRVTSEIEDLIAQGKDAEAINLAQGIFGTKGALDFSNAIKSGALNLTDIEASLGATGDTIIGLAGETMNFAEKWQILKNNALSAIEPIASTVFDILGGAIEKILPIFESFAGVFEGFANVLAENEWLFYVIAGLIGGAMLIGMLALTAATWNMVAASWALVAPILANPLTWVILAAVAAIALLSYGIYQIVKNWDDIVTQMTNVWGAFTNWIGTSLASIGEFFTGLGYGIGEFFTGIWDNIVKGIQWVSEKLDQLFSVGDKFGINLFGSVSMTGVPRMATGGLVKPRPGGTLAVLGEAGRAEVVLDENKFNLMADALTSQNYSGGGGGMTLVINQADGESTADLVDRIKDFIYLEGITL